ncbi:MAG: hypothetical protein U0414_32340 [Polyangiaceae bacterium]
MQSFRARVRNGQVVLDDASPPLPEGAELEIFVANDGELDEEPALMESLRRGLREAKAGQGIDADEVIAEFEAEA